MASVFTKIAQGTLPSYKLFEDDHFMVILDAFPIKRGHALVIPKEEVPDLFDLDAATYAAIWALSKRAAGALKRSISCERIAVVVIGFEVPHAHIHLIPVDSEAELDFSRKKRFTAAEFSATQAEIKAVF